MCILILAEYLGTSVMLHSLILQVIVGYREFCGVTSEGHRGEMALMHFFISMTLHFATCPSARITDG